MMVIWKKVWRDLWGRKWRSSQVVLSIAVGVFAIGLTLGMLDTVQEGMSRAWQSANPSHILIGVGDGVTDDVLHFISTMPDLEGAEGIISKGIRWKQHLDDPWESATIVFRENYENMQYDRLALIEGSWPIREGLAVEKSGASKFNIPSGGTVYLEVSDRPRPMRVVGRVYDATTVPALFTNEATFFVTRRDMERLGGPTTFTGIKASVPKYDEDSVKSASLEIVGRLEELDIDHGTPQVFDPERPVFQEVVEAMFFILVVMAFVALGMSILLVINTVTAVITEQIPQIGIMKAVGASSARIFVIYLSGVLIYIAAALAIAIPLAVVASFALSSITLELFNIDPGEFKISWNGILAQLALGFLAPPIAALRPLIAGARISVREAVSTYGLSERAGLIASVMTRLRFLTPLVILTVTNTFRRKWRLILTQVALVGGGAVFIMVLSVRASLLDSFAQLQESYSFDIFVMFDRPQRLTDVEGDIRLFQSVDSIEGMEILLETRLRRPDDVYGRDEKSMTLIAISKGGEGYRPPVTQGRWLMPQDKNAIVLNQHLADELGLGVDDEVILELNEDDSTWTIVGLSFDLNNNQTASVAWLEEVAKETGTGTNMGSVVFIQTTTSSQEILEQLADDISERLEGRGKNIVFSLTFQEWENLQVSVAIVIVYLLGALGVLIAIVGSVGLSGTLSINALERRREVGMMRAIGASRKAIAGLFIGEGVIIGLLSWIIAIPLSIPIGWIFATAVGEAIDLQLIYQYSIAGVFIWLLVVVVLSVLASWMPAWRATRTSVREALLYE